MRYYITLMLWLLAFHASAQENHCLAEDLEMLDQVVAQKRVYDQNKQKDIDNTKQELGSCLTAMDKYVCYEQLYNKYMKWIPDSAKHYARLDKEVALANNWKDLYVKACINEAFILVLCGDLLEASTAIQQIGDIKNLQKDNQISMAMLLLEFSLRAELKDFESLLAKNSKEAWYAYSRYLPRNDWRYHYYEAMLLQQPNKLSWLLAEMKHSQQPSMKMAALGIVTAKIYYIKKDYDNYIHYLILSAINDIKCSNHEASSLLFLINSPHLCLNPDKAFKYAMLCTENAQIFKDQGRSLEIVKAHAKITKSYQWRLQMKAYILYVIIGLLGVAIVAVGLLLAKNRKKKKEQEVLIKKLEEANNSLQAMMEKDKKSQAQLQTANNLLRDEISFHNQNFFNIYHLISKYNADVQDFKKLIYNLITAGKYDKARKELHSNSASEKYLKSFFEHFDQAFLLSHPDFVNRFNALLRPECRIIPPADKVLTPELRIYALVSIGITDSVSIAQFLHYSTQTVYNYRLKVRHNACVAENCFADTVARMYGNTDHAKGQEATQQ